MDLESSEEKLRILHKVKPNGNQYCTQDLWAWLRCVAMLPRCHSFSYAHCAAAAAQLCRFAPPSAAATSIRPKYPSFRNCFRATIATNKQNYANKSFITKQLQQQSMHSKMEKKSSFCIYFILGGTGILRDATSHLHLTSWYFNIRENRWNIPTKSGRKISSSFIFF